MKSLLFVLGSILLTQPAPKAPSPVKRTPPQKFNSPRPRPPLAKKPRPAKKKTSTASKPKTAPGRMAPEKCRRIVDATVERVDLVLKPMLAEIRLGKDKNLQRGYDNAKVALDQHSKRILELRAQAIEMQKSLLDDDKKRCDGHAFTAFHRLLTRYAAAIGPYRAQPGIFRALGRLFQEHSATKYAKPSKRPTAQ